MLSYSITTTEENMMITHIDYTSAATQQIALDTGSPEADRSAHYVDWAGEEVEAQVHRDGSLYGIDGPAVTISEVEFGGTRSVEASLTMLREVLQAPQEIVSWVERVAAAT